MNGPEATQDVIRVDRYNIVVNEHTIRATDGQERRIRAMDAEQRARFLKIMGCPE